VSEKVTTREAIASKKQFIVLKPTNSANRAFTRQISNIDSFKTPNAWLFRGNWHNPDPHKKVKN
jgi:hypothetical protein